LNSASLNGRVRGGRFFSRRGPPFVASQRKLSTERKSAMFFRQGDDDPRASKRLLLFSSSSRVSWRRLLVGAPPHRGRRKNPRGPVEPISGTGRIFSPDGWHSTIILPTSRMDIVKKHRNRAEGIAVRYQLMNLVPATGPVGPGRRPLSPENLRGP